MNRYRGLVWVIAAAVATATGVAHADPIPPGMGAACPPELADVMTLLPDQTTYAVCRQSGPDFAWTAVETPFPPNDSWLSYGPAITLHGQGMRNPNLSSGEWTATPLDPETICRVTQSTVVEAGVLAPPQVSEGPPGTTMRVLMLPSLFYAELAGNCLWTMG